LHARATDVLHGVPKRATYEETLEALEDRFGNQLMAAAYRSHIKARIQCVGESLQEFTTAVEQVDHRAYSALPEGHIRKEAGKAFASGAEGAAIKIHLLLEREMVNEALRQVV
jgi:hypothetical protein